MIKKNKKKLLISSIIILLPIVVGLILWNKLPDTMAIHFGFDGKADNSAVKGYIVFFLPLILLAFHWLGMVITSLDPKNKHQTPKAQNLVFWIVPCISILFMTIIYLTAFGIRENNIFPFLFLAIGLGFAIIGNYLPKCRQNYTLGIKIKWTLQSQENWNVTHRLGGKVWLIGGLLIMVTALIPYNFSMFIVLGILVVITVIPLVYSYIYYRKQLKQETNDIVPLTNHYKKTKIIVFCSVFVMLVGIGYIMFSGEVNVEYGETSFTVHSTYWSDVSVDYSQIDNIEYKNSSHSGSKTMAFNSAKLLLGKFHNEEYGTYQRYSYRKSLSEVVLTQKNGSILVLSGDSETNTEEIFRQLKERCEK
ncbi:MAG: SdpI family protein [Clostridia bacterium]|nr:SdpI family protein [Clostridia bacterium]